MQKVIEANLEYMYIVKKTDILKKFAKITHEHSMKYHKIKFDYLNNLPVDMSDPSAVSIVTHL